jgi:hypothetical protein
MYKNNFHQFIQVISNPLKYRLFLLSKLPLAFFTGLKIDSVSQLHCAVSIKYKWLNKNPFRSIYFASLSMAAELSTGVLCFGNIYKQNPSVSMLVTNMQASFSKKAIGNIVFTCSNGKEVKEAVEMALLKGNGTTIQLLSTGKNEDGEVVAEFHFTWSFKAKSSQ